MEKVEIMKVVNSDGSKSSKMLLLYNGGLSISEISKIMGVRYNFVYNVVSNSSRMGKVEMRKDKKEGSVKDSVIVLLKEGKSISEICIELKKNYSYVWKIRKDWELENRMKEE